MFTKKTVRDYDFGTGKRVLVTVDFNVPVNNDGTVIDDYRIRQTLPTLKYLLEKHCSLVLIGHLGRPTSKDDLKTSFKHVAERLSDLLGQPVEFATDCIGDEAKKVADRLQPGLVALFENVRYHEGEEANDLEFAHHIVEASGAEVFVQDGFGTAHRKYASYDAITKQGIPAIAGLLLEKEIDTITNVMQSPERPLMVVVGGAKISDKIEILKKFIDIADYVAVVGALANTFLLAEGHSVGTSLAEPNDVPLAKEIMEAAHEKAKNSRFTFFVPRDVVVARDISAQSETRIVDLSHNTWADIESYPKSPKQNAFTVADDEKILDIGPFSASYIAGAMKFAKTVIWNGTCGVTEVKGLSGAQDPFAHGTKILVEAMVGEAGQQDHPFVVVGGGDTVSFVESQDGLREQLGHVSTGGGASLDLMAGKELPGVVVLEDK
jgi:phosphoglycerate kinase